MEEMFSYLLPLYTLETACFRLWFHFTAAYIITAFVCFLLYNESVAGIAVIVCMKDQLLPQDYSRKERLSSGCKNSSRKDILINLPGGRSGRRMHESDGRGGVRSVRNREGVVRFEGCRRVQEGRPAVRGDQCQDTCCLPQHILPHEDRRVHVRAGRRRCPAAQH